jgi:hypothetical protein
VLIYEKVRETWLGHGRQRIEEYGRENMWVGPRHAVKFCKIKFYKNLSSFRVAKCVGKDRWTYGVSGLNGRSPDLRTPKSKQVD